MAAISLQTASSPVASDVDVRGFVYELEPLRQKEQWKLDELMSDFAQAKQALSNVETRMSDIMDRHDREASAASQALEQRFAAEAHQRLLQFLAHLRAQWQLLDTERKARQGECERLREAVVAQQLQIERLARHRDDALAEYVDDVRRRNAVEQDRDWLARRGVDRTGKSSR